MTRYAAKADVALLPGRPALRVSSGQAAAALIGALLMIAAFGIAAAFALDPTGTYFGFSQAPVLKYLPVELAVCSLPWLLVGSSQRVRPGWAFVSLTLMCLWVLGGSVYTVAVLGHSPDDSYLGRALGMLALFPAMLVTRSGPAWSLIRRWIWRFSCTAAAGITIGLCMWAAGIRFVDRPNLYHEEVFIPVAVAVALFATGRPSFLRSTIASFFLLAGVLSFKNTGFLASALAGWVCAYLLWKKPSNTLGERLIRRYLVVQSVVLVLVAAGVAVFTIPELLPSGTPQVRLQTYGMRWLMFVDSPWVGQNFVGAPGLELGHRVIQSHSDLLDLLAFGGIVGVSLMIPPLAGVIRRSIRDIANHADAAGSGTVLMWAIAPLVALEMLFNPIWHQPQLSLYFWSAVGLILAERGTFKWRPNEVLNYHDRPQ